MTPWLLRNKAVVAIGVAALVAVFLFSDLLVFLPAHRAGKMQPLLGVANALAHIVALPGAVIGQRVIPAVNHHYTVGARVVFLLLSAAFYGFCTWAVLWSRARRRERNDAIAASEERDTGVRVSRRGFIGMGAGGVITSLAVAGGSGAFLYGFAIEPRLPRITRHRLSLLGLPRELVGLRVLQMTDIHHGPWTSEDYIHKLVRLANAQSPDVVVLTGDYVHHSPEYIGPVVKILDELKPTIGTLAVLGNHDWWENAPATQRAFASTTITLIDNDRRFITPARGLSAEASEGLCIAGIGDLWEDQQDFAAAFRDVPADAPTLLLSHNPDAATDLQDELKQHRVDLMLSGHTHGGQIRLPFMGTPIVPSAYGQKYAYGFVEGPGCRVYVSSGTGTTVLPIRFGVRPEIVVFELA